MGLEKIKEEILHKAQAAEKEILAEAAKKVAEIKKIAAERIKQLEREASQKLEAETASMENRESSLASMESRRMLFEARKSAVDKAYREASDKIKDMPSKDRENLIKKMIELAKKEIDVDTIFINEKDRKYCKERAKINSMQNDGIICETKDGNVRVNLTFNSIFSELREKTARRVSEILFG